MKTFKNILLCLGYWVLAYFGIIIYAICSLAWVWLPLMFTFYGKSFWIGLAVGIFVSSIAHIIYKEATN